MAQWTYRASSANTAGAAAGGALGISPGVTPASGNLAVVVVLWEPDTNTVTPPAGFTELHAGGQANTGLHTIRVYGKITTGSESLPYTFTPGVGGNWRGLVIALYEGGTGALTVDVSGASQGDSQSEANQTAPSVTTTGADRLLIRAGGNSAANPSSMTGAATNLRGVSGGASLADGIKASAGATGVTEAHGAGTDDYVGIHIAIISDAAPSQYARPDSDITGSPTWTGDGGETTNLYQRVDETTASDTDYIRSVTAPAADVHEVGLSDITDPASSANHILRYRYRKQATGDAIALTVGLYEGATQRATWAESDIATSWATQERTLSGGEADSITDYTALRVRLSATQGTPATVPTYVGAGTPLVATTVSGGTLSPTLPAGTAANDIAVLVAHTSSNIDFSDTITGWTKITPGGVAENNTAALRVECWARRLTGSGDAPTVPGMADGNVRIARIFAVRGCSTSGTVVDAMLANRSNNASSLTVTLPSCDAGANTNTLSVLAYTYVTDPSAATTVSGFAAWNVATTTTGIDAACGMGATRSNSGSGTLTGGTATVSGGTFSTSVNVGLHFVFKPASTAARANVSWLEFQVPEAPSGGGGGAVLAGAAAGTSTAGVATLRLNHALVGASAGTSTAGANLATAKPLAGASAGTSTAGANLATAKPLAGASAGTSTAGATALNQTQPLAGAAAGTSTAGADLTAGGGVSAALAGAAAGTATAGATLRMQHALVGSSAGTSTAGANLLTAKPLVGSSAGTSTAGVTTLRLTHPLAGSTAGTSTAGATLRLPHPLVGATAGTSTAGGTVDIPLPKVSDRAATPVHLTLGGRGRTMATNVRPALLPSGGARGTVMSNGDATAVQRKVG